MTISVGSVLDGWGVGRHNVELCAPSTLPMELESHTFESARIWCDTPAGFDDTCRIFLPADATESPDKVIIRHLTQVVKSNITIVILKPTKALAISIGGPTARIFIGHFGFKFRAQMNLWRDPLVCVGDEATANGLTAIANTMQRLERFGGDQQVL